MLSRRLAHIRTWTYIAQCAGWVHDENHWRGVTHAVEGRLSDAFHGALTQRFVDRRTSVLLRRLKQKEGLVAKVSESGDVTVEDQFVGRLEGFRFSLDKSASPEQAKTLRPAALAALKPEFHLRADRFYNAPDTEIDFTDQGGLMWGANAIGKLIKGSDALKPQVVAFVDDDAGPEIAEKVRRRLQHFTDRKVATQFAPLFALQNDDTLAGLARGFGFRLIEALGVLARDKVVQEVKELDQDARAMLRKHGIRFGQFTIFMPLLLKPAPTRLRLVLWAIAQDLAEFPASPPPGLVTIVTDAQAPAGWDTMSGYRAAGARAIRIDMLERLADMLRAENSRSGFEGTADMLSITGTTLNQFADLMQGLGYKAVKGERTKVKAPGVGPKAAPTPPDSDFEGAASDSTPSENAGAPEVKLVVATPENVAGNVPGNVSEGTAETVTENVPETVAQNAQNVTSGVSDHPQHATPLTGQTPEMEVFYTFTWARPRAPVRSDTATEGAREGHSERKTRSKPATKRAGKGPGKGPRAGTTPPRDGKAKTYQARPEKRDRIDPDNPFAAALMGLREKK